MPNNYNDPLTVKTLFYQTLNNRLHWTIIKTKRKTPVQNLLSVKTRRQCPRRKPRPLNPCLSSCHQSESLCPVCTVARHLRIAQKWTNT